MGSCCRVAGSEVARAQRAATRHPRGSSAGGCLNQGLIILMAGLPAARRLHPARAWVLLVQVRAGGQGDPGGSNAVKPPEPHAGVAHSVLQSSLTGSETAFTASNCDSSMQVTLAKGEDSAPCCLRVRRLDGVLQAVAHAARCGRRGAPRCRARQCRALAPALGSRFATQGRRP
jgi:hypothetical protein